MVGDAIVSWARVSAIAPPAHRPPSTVDNSNGETSFLKTMDLVASDQDNSNPVGTDEARE
jgi:hypothetical protein